MEKIVIGQRFISAAEPELGLGIVSFVENKAIKILFLGSNSERTYSLSSAPIKRVVYSVGDEISLRSGEKDVVLDKSELDGIIIYHTASLKFDERELADHLNFSRPQDRLLNGQIDHLNLFHLRRKTIDFKNKITKNKIQGLIGPKLRLLPHQYYVASKVTERAVPRVLLADEVGLGKTIEAGLIIHKLIVTERAKRVLILVPDSLVYQWFIELHKKFHLNFTTLNQETHLEPGTNPFFDSELVIVNIGLLKGAEMARSMIKEVEWDLLVIDEAHQLKWEENNPSIEFKIAQMISKRSKGLLLLTATPEQMGLEGHFARLSLIDSNRFYSYAQFLDENKKYVEVANEARALISKNASGEFDKEISQLQDMHGTGRVLFRNTREKMANEYSFFPKRKLISDALVSTDCHLLGLFDEETIGPNFDAKLDWLYTFLENKKTEKILLITKSKTKVLCLEKLLKDHFPNLKIAVFHSGLSFIARDREAQYFADPKGAQILLCTEVGSEGRNFEFANNLIIFDLPLTPDQLEQRVGRLDRIGQSSNINIYVPYLKDSYEEILFRFFHDGLDAFNHCAKGANLVFQGLKSLLDEYLVKPELLINHRNIFDEFISTVKKEYNLVLKNLDEGRDILIELNSFNEKESHQIIDEIKSIDLDVNLENYMMEVFSELGVEVEDLDDSIFYIHPSDNMFVPYFPTLDSDGKRITFDRDVGISRDDVEFLSWDHPMVLGIMELILTNNIGNSAAVSRKEKSDKKKTFLECFFNLDVVAPRKLLPDRFLSLSAIRIMIDTTGENFSDKFSMDLIDSKVEQLDPQMVLKLRDLPKNKVAGLIKEAHDYAVLKSKEIKDSAVKNMESCLQEELERLMELKKVNPVVREEEIEVLKEQMCILKSAYEKADLRLDAIRFIS